MKRIQEENLLWSEFAFLLGTVILKFVGFSEKWAILGGLVFSAIYFSGGHVLSKLPKKIEVITS